MDVNFHGLHRDSKGKDFIGWHTRMRIPRHAEEGPSNACTADSEKGSAPIMRAGLKKLACT